RKKPHYPPRPLVRHRHRGTTQPRPHPHRREVAYAARAPPSRPTGAKTHPAASVPRDGWAGEPDIATRQPDRPPPCRKSPPPAYRQRTTRRECYKRRVFADSLILPQILVTDIFC